MSYVGVDWAGGLWLVVATGDDVTVTTEPSILNVWTEHGTEADAMLVDIPIGLPEEGYRACDRTAAEFLDDRSSAVFSIPCRDAVQAECYEEAREACGGSLGSQSWWLFPRILEVDVFLQTVDSAKETVYESHPEVCFAAYEGAALSSKGTDSGLDTRMEVLEAVNEELHDEVETVLDDREDGAAWHDRISTTRLDDVVAAAVLAATAEELNLGQRHAGSDYPSLPDKQSGGPDEPGNDPVLEVPMEIIFPGRDVAIDRD